MSEQATPTLTTSAAPPPLHPNTTPSTSTKPNSKGIDIQQALSILSARGAHGHDHSHAHDNSQSKSGATTKDMGNKACGCHGDPVPDDADGMGQTIDLLEPSSSNKEEEKATAAVANADEIEKQRQQLAEDRKQRKIQIQQALDNMSVKELLQHVMKTQQDRVAAYREYERYVFSLFFVGTCRSST